MTPNCRDETHIKVDFIWFQNAVLCLQARLCCVTCDECGLSLERKFVWCVWTKESKCQLILILYLHTKKTSKNFV